MITEALYDLLTTNAGITAVCSNVYPTMRPLRIDPPFIVFTMDSDERDRLLSGSEGTYRMASVTIDCYDTSLNDAISIADAVESALTDFSGIMGTTSPEVDVNHVRLEQRGPHQFETDTEYHRVPLEFLIGYEV